MKARIIFLGAALVLSVACNKGTSEAKLAAAAAAAPARAEAPGQPGQPPAPVKPVPAQIPDVLARINGEAVNREEFEGALRGVEAQAGGPVPAERRDEIYRSVLDQVISFHLLSQEAKARKIVPTDEEIKARIDQIRSQFPTAEAFTKGLAEQHTSVEDLQQGARQGLGVSKLLQDEIKVAVDPKDAQTFYLENRERFQEGEAVHASHILIKLEQGANAKMKAAAKAKADAILKQIKAGSDFAKLAKEQSQDPGSAANGGDLGFFTKGQMVPPFEAAAFDLKPGTMSGVVESPFGFHIIKAIERRPERALPFPEVSEQIASFLVEQQRQAKTNAFVNQLKAKAKIELFI